MAIIKLVKRENPYVQIDKRAIDDPNLSWESTGLLAYLIARPKDWKISISHLSKVKKNKETATRTALSELREFNYCHYFEVRKSGKIVETFYLIFELPVEYKEIQSEIDIELKEGEKLFYKEFLTRKEKGDLMKQPKVENQQSAKSIETHNVLPIVENPKVEKAKVENRGLLNKDYILNKDYTNNKTTTEAKKEVVKNSSSFLEENSIEKIKIEEVLKNYNLSKITKNNIIKLYLKNLITTDRIIRVFEVAKEKEWGDGAIYKALKENWNIETKKENKIILSKAEIKEKIKGRVNYYLNSMRETDDVEEVKNKLMIDINSIENINNFKELVVEYLSKFDDIAIKEKKGSKEIIKEREEKNATVTILKNGEAEDNENNSLSFIKRFLMLDENLKDEIFIKAEKLFKGSKEMLLMFKKINITGYVNTIIREIKTVINSDYKEINYLLQ